MWLERKSNRCLRCLDALRLLSIEASHAVYFSNGSNVLRESFLFSGLLSDVRIRDHPLAWLDGEWSENLNDATWTIHHYWNGTNDATATLLLLFVQCRAMPRVLCAVLYMPCYLSVCSFVSLARFSYTLRLCVDFRFAPVQTERTFILYNTTIFQTIIFSSSRIVSGFDALIVKRRCSVDSF